MAKAPLIALVVCATLGAAAHARAQAGAAPTIIIVVRSGKLGEAEVSPRAASRAPVLWRIALEGVTLTQIERGASLIPAAPLEDLRRLLVPEDIDVSLVDLSPGTGAPSRDLHPAVVKLREVFRAPPPPDAREVDIVESLRKSLGAREEAFHRGEASVQAGSLTDPGLIFREAAARLRPLILVRIFAEDDGDDSVARRDGALKSIIDAAAPDAHVLVFNFPNGGPGTLVAQGPRFKKARVIPRSVALASLRGTIASLVDKTAQKEDGSAAEEPIREIFR